MAIKSQRLAVALGLLLFGSAQAQTQDLMDIYELALQNDPTLRAAQQQLESVRETKVQAKALLLPNIQLGGGLNALNRDVTDAPLKTLERSEGFQTDSLSLSLLQPIYHREYWVQLEQADSVIAQAEADYQSARLDLMARTIQAYFNVLAADDDLTVAKAQTKANKRQLDQAQQRFDVGLIAITDVAEARAAYDGSRADQIAAENAVDNAWESLLEITLAPRQELAKLGDKIPLSPPVPADLEQWASTALEQNYGIIAAKNGVAAQQQTIEVQRSGHYPTLDVVASYGTDRSNADAGLDVNTGVIGLQFNLPIYQGGAVSSRTRQAEYDYQAARERLEQQQRSVNRQVRNAYRSVVASISRVDALNATVVSSKTALESTEAGYDVGTRTLVDVLTVQSSMFNSTRNYLGSRYTYIISGLLLKQAASTLTRKDLESVNNWLVK